VTPPRRIPWLLLGLALLLVVFDQWSKAEVFSFLGYPGARSGEVQLVTECHNSVHPRYLVLGESPFLAWMTSLNDGAAFGRLDSVPRLLFTGRVLAVILLGVMLVRSDARRPWLRLALMLVLAGALGNLLDNLAHDAAVGGYISSGEIYERLASLVRLGADFSPGDVRDFIDCRFQIGSSDWHFPTFNVADSCISVGAVLLILGGMGKEPDDEESADQAPGA